MKLKIVFSFLLVVVLLTPYTYAASMDTVEVLNAAMNKKIKAVVITPTDDAKGKGYPVYLLHSFADTFKTLVTNVQPIKEDADVFRFIIVCSGGGRSQDIRYKVSNA